MYRLYAYSNLVLLYTAKNTLGRKTKTLLCECLLISYLNFCGVVHFSCLTLQYCKRLQRVQNSCIMLCSYMDCDVMCTLYIRGWNGCLAA